MRRWIRRRRATQRIRLAADVLRLAGFADAAVATAERLNAPVPEDARACLAVWREWAWRLARWAADDA
jgi:hypothetical protein